MSSKISIIVGAILCLSSITQAEDLEAKFYKEIAIRSGMKVEDPATRALLGDIPDGLSLKEMSPTCDPRHFEESVVGKKLTNKQYFSITKKYFEKCGAELSSQGSKGLLGLLKFSEISYSFLNHPQIKTLKIKLSGGTTVPAILALKADPRPRPLVLVRCGVFCSAEAGASMKSYMMHLFDQSPFNVMLLASQTGEDYVVANGTVSLGGWSEGYETLEIGKWLTEKWEYRDRISSLHMMGISLGGNTAVIGAAFNDKYYMDNGRKLFNSVTAICPVVSLKPTLEYLYNNGLVGVVFAEMTRKHFRNTRWAVKDVPDLISDGKLPWTRSGFTDFIGNVASAALNRRSIASTPDAYFKTNNFWNLKEEVKTPLMLWASKDDIVVNPKINAAVVESSDVYEKSENVGVLNIPYGSHCAFSTAYGAQASAAVLRTFVLNNSPEFIEAYDSKKVLPWKFGFDKLSGALEHVSQKWTFFANSKEAKVEFKIYLRQYDNTCANSNPWNAPSKCFQTRTKFVPVSALKVMGARVPASEAQAQALSREFNTKVEFRVKTGPLGGTNKSEFFMAWRSNFE